MKIFITGGSGFIGTYLSNFFLQKGHQVIAVGTRACHDRDRSDRFDYISADTTQKGLWQEKLNQVDAAVNLAGNTIGKRWTRSYKKQIYDSRILTTRNLVEALPQDKNVILCSASAVGYYGNRGEDILAEDALAGNDFLAGLSQDWEKEALPAKEKGARVVITRFGLVLGRGGGVLGKMLPAFRFFVGGPLGDGRQWFPWIHLQDLASALWFVIQKPEISGPVNFTAPDPVRHKDLAKTLGQFLKRPSVMPAPGFMLRLALGEMGQALLSSQRAIPSKLTKSGFIFKFPAIEKAISDLVA